MGANRTAVLGHIDCPVCGFDMQVKHDKNGQASGYCPDCSQQLFTRTDHKSNLLLARMRAAAAAGAPVAAPASAAAPPAPAPAIVPTVKAAPARQDDAQAVNVIKPKETHAQPVKAPPAPVKSVGTGWFAPLLGSTARKGQQQNG
jgi:Zn-finger nucleic acid-binding protein